MTACAPKGAGLCSSSGHGRRAVPAPRTRLTVPSRSFAPSYRPSPNNMVVSSQAATSGVLISETTSASTVPTSNVWELDFCSRYVVDSPFYHLITFMVVVSVFILNNKGPRAPYNDRCGTSAFHPPPRSLPLPPLPSFLTVIDLKCSYTLLYLRAFLLDMVSSPREVRIEKKGRKPAKPIYAPHP